ncbi:MAG TPA: SIMPL domain-containing protein [Verrucomicrobiae bacterium]|nr:SIMPL domain-containing protein [Verrucomicrobiae bacterium]
MTSRKLWLALLLLTATVAIAQEHPSVAAQSNTVFVSADGKFEAPPDTAQIQFNVSSQEDTPQAAFQTVSKDVEQVRQVLRTNGIDPKMANVGFFSVQPIYDWRNPKQRIIAYRVTTDITLKLKDFSKIGAILQGVADANVSESQSMTYTLENMDAAKDKAVEDAYRRARESAETLARASGRMLGDLSYASVDTFENARMPVMRREMAMTAMAKAAPAPTEEFTPQTVTVTAHVNALFNLK